MTTRGEFIAAADDAGIEASAVRGGGNGVNVWRVPGDRVPATTVWWFDGDHIEWGQNYEHQAPHDIPAAALVARVVETMNLPRTLL